MFSEEVLYKKWIDFKDVLTFNSPSLVRRLPPSPLSNNIPTERDVSGKTTSIHSLCLIGSDVCETQFFSPRFSVCNSITPRRHNALITREIQMTFHGLLATMKPTLEEITRIIYFNVKVNNGSTILKCYVKFSLCWLC